MNNKNYTTSILIAILTIYSLFSFVWLSVLYISNNGQSICGGESFPCSIKFPLTSQVKSTVAEATNSSKQLSQQKIAKNKLKLIYDELSVLDDDMVSEQAKLEKAIKQYQKFIDTNIVFINKKPQVLPNLNENNYEIVKDALQVEMDSIKAKLIKKSERKVILKQQVDGLYNDLVERQSNNFIGNNQNQTPVELVDPNVITDQSEEQ